MSKSSYAQMYKTLATSCLYTSKINIYTNPAFQSLPPLNMCVLPIYPSAHCNTSCTCSNTSSSSSCACK